MISIFQFNGYLVTKQQTPYRRSCLLPRCGWKSQRESLKAVIFLPLWRSESEIVGGRASPSHGCAAASDT